MIFLLTIKRKHFLSVLCFLFFTSLSFGQIRNGELQSWNDVILKYDYSEKLSVVGDAGARYYFDTHWSVFYVRPALQWRLTNSFSITGGVAFFYNLNPDYDNVNDLRIFQMAELVWPRIAGFKFHHRVMVEERWFVTKIEPTQYKVRGRYRFGVETPYYSLGGGNKSIYNIVFIEFLGDLDTNDLSPFNKYQRYTLVAGHDITDRVGMELHYQLHSILLDSGMDIQQNIVRIRLKLNLNAS